MTGKRTDGDDDWGTPQLSMNLHPDMPRPNIPDDIHLDKWGGIDKTDMASQRFTYGHISKTHWEQIFGKRD